MEVERGAEDALNSLLPEKCKPKYEKAYNKFSNWMEEKKLSSICEKKKHSRIF